MTEERLITHGFDLEVNLDPETTMNAVAEKLAKQQCTERNVRD
jgi:hypothetical protein